MCRPHYFRLLSAIAFLFALPALCQTHLDSYESQISGARPPSANESKANPLADRSPESNPQLTPKEIGDRLSVRRQYQAAIQSYSEIHRPSADVWNAMGIAYQMMFDLKDAARCYKSALKIDPLNPQFLNNLATIEDESKRYSTAERTYRKALRIDPRSALVLKNLGTNLLTQRKYEEGSKIYAQALAVNPHIFEVNSGPSISEPGSIRQRGITNYFKARSCARAGLNDCAVAFLRRALNEGSTTVKEIDHDSAFDSMRNDSKFHLMLAQEQ